MFFELVLVVLSFVVNVEPSKGSMGLLEVQGRGQKALKAFHRENIMPSKVFLQESEGWKSIEVSEEVKEGSVKADRDTLRYDGDPAVYLGQNTYKYWWVTFDVKRLRPAFDPAESTFVLTSVIFYIYTPTAGSVCSLKVYDKYDILVYKTTYTLTTGTGWKEIPINPGLILYDTFTVVLYIPVSNAARNQICLDDGSRPDSMCGVIYNNTWYIITSRDLNIRAVGHFESVHDVSLWEIYYPSHPYCIAEPETLFYHIYNFGNFDETGVPTTIYFDGYTFNPALNVNRKSYAPYEITFTPLSEGLLRVGGYTNLSSDQMRSNDTFPDFYFYLFPKYTDPNFALDFEAIASFPPTGWVTRDLDGDGKTWSLYVSSFYSHSGRYFAGSVYNSSGNNDWLISPAISVIDTCNNAFGFWAKSISSSYPEHLMVYLLSSQNPQDTIVKLLDYDGLPATWTRFTFSLDQYRGSNVYVGFRNASVDKFYLLLDDFFVRRVPLEPTGIIAEEFEEILTPPGWQVAGNLWMGGSCQDAGVPDNGSNVFYFNSGASAGSQGELISPMVKFTRRNNFVSFTFDYCNVDGNDSIQVYYRLDPSSDWMYYGSYDITGTGWRRVVSREIYLPADKQVAYFQIKLVGFTDGGTSNIAVDNFKVYNGSVLFVSEPVSKGVSLEVKTLSSGLHLKVSGLQGEANLKVFDVSGRVVKEIRGVRNGTYTLSELRPGVYFVTLDGPSKLVKKAFVVK